MATPEELMAKGICPVKPEYLRKIQERKLQEVVTGAGSGVDVAEAQPKSKSKHRQERANQKQNDLCINFVQGKCIHAERCRYSHDVEAYLGSKPADLPGSCPFASQTPCPFGITCRWAGNHSYTDQMQERLQQYRQKQQQQQQEQQQQQGQGAEGGDAANGADAANGGDAANGASHGAASGAKPVVMGAALAGLGADVDTLLPVGESVDKVVNVLDKELQNKLWKNRYDFGRADSVLRELGLRNTQRGASNGSNGGRGGGRGGKQQGRGQRGQKQGGEDAAAAEAEAGAAGEAQGDGEGQGLEPGPEPELKRQKVDEASTNTAAEPAPANGAPANGASTAAAEATLGTDAAAVAALGAAEAKGGEAQDWAGMHVETPLKPEEKKVLNLRGKTYLAPLTTVGNLPFRRVCKVLGADITCGEMALATNLLQGQASEWALLKRHPCEDLFGVQVCGGFPDALARTAQLIDENISVDFVDVNMGCPIDIVCDRSAGSALLRRPQKMEEIARAMSRSMSCPLTLKTRKGYNDGQDITHTLVPNMRSWGVSALTLHGRTRQQRYSRQADWQYIEQCADLAPDLPLIGNGDIFSYTDWNAHMEAGGGRLTTCMIGRGALIKPWLFTEIKEQRHWDISASERLDMIKKFCSFGLEHWGADNRGVENTRRFLLEWLSYLCRYVPVALLEVVPQQMHWRPPALSGRSDLETLLSSDSAADWVKISEMLLGPVPQGFTFSPKHKSNAYAAGPAGANGGGEDQAEG